VSWDNVREITQSLYLKAPYFVTTVYVVVVVVAVVVLIMGSYGLYQFLFVTPIKKDASGQTIIVNINGNNNVVSGLPVGTGPAPVPPSAGPVPPSTAPVPPSPARPPAIDVDALVVNGGFEQGVAGWGTGWFEGFFPRPPGEALTFNHAIAHWYIDDRTARVAGGRALRIEHESRYAPNVFSTFSQRIKVKPAHWYEVKFWIYLEAYDQKGLSLRVLPSRATRPEEWDRFKAKPDASVIGRWQEVRMQFLSEAEWFFDLRFAAEAPLKAWVGDVSVTPIGEAREIGLRQPLGTKK